MFIFYHPLKRSLKKRFKIIFALSFYWDLHNESFKDCELCTLPEREKTNKTPKYQKLFEKSW